PTGLCRMPATKVLAAAAQAVSKVDRPAHRPWQNRHRAQPECCSPHDGQDATDASQAPVSPGPHTKTTLRSAHQSPAFPPPAIDAATNHIRNGLSAGVFQQPARHRLDSTNSAVK